MIASNVEKVLMNKVKTCRMPTPAYPASRLVETALQDIPDFTTDRGHSRTQSADDCHHCQHRRDTNVRAIRPYLLAFRGFKFVNPRLAYFVTICRDLGATALGAAGEITNDNQAFQPSGRFCASNSL
jgi:hypothetical protein